MRPRPIDRGNSFSSFQGRDHASRFNEAATNRSRKPYNLPRSTFIICASMRPRPIDRGNRSSRGRAHSQPLASMRPRPIDRGNSASGATSRPATMGFNEAATNRSRKHPHQDHLRQLALASMRPRPIDRGNPEPAELVVVDRRRASMRPRPIDRGNSDRLSCRSGIISASMRPRPIDRGNRLTPSPTAGQARGFNEAATNRSRKPRRD